jgi:dTDP-4-amino-4,6-dideoxygalactose transaminase
VNQEDARLSANAPLFAEPLHVGRPNLGDRERLFERFADILDRRWLTNDGPYVQEFEQEVGAYLGVKHCVAVCNATIGLQIAIRTLGLTGEVIVPSFTFPATVHALHWEGVTPVFCDVDPTTHNVDVADAERLISPRTTGIVGVHLWGNACDDGALSDLSRRHGLRLLYDAAHAFGCSHGGRMIGNFGDCEVFSFHATKFLNSAEGGAIVTNDAELAVALRQLRNFGLTAGAVESVGTNAKMTEFCAAMGLTSLESRDEFIERNRENHSAYRDAFSTIPGIRLLFGQTSEPHNWQYVVAEVDRRIAGVSRDEVVAALHSQNVLAKKYFSPGCHRMPPYAATHDPARSPLPHTELLCDRLLQLPTGSGVTRLDIARIADFMQSTTARRRRAA